MNVLNTVELQVGLQKALGISSYVDNPSYWSQFMPIGFVLVLGAFVAAVAVFPASVGETCKFLAISIFVVFAVPFLMKISFIEITDEERLTSAIESSIPSDYVSQEIRDSFAESGWAVDCAGSEDSLLCGGTRLDTVVPAQRENGEKADVSLRINYDDFLDSNNVNSGNHDQRIVAPGEPLTINVDVVKATGER